MTEALLQKLEERMMMLLTEVEDLRKDVQYLRSENANLKFERENHTKKVHDMLSLLDAINVVDAAMANANVSNLSLHTHVAPIKPMLVQGMAAEQADKEYVQSN